MHFWTIHSEISHLIEPDDEFGVIKYLQPFTLTLFTGKHVLITRERNVCARSAVDIITSDGVLALWLH